MGNPGWYVGFIVASLLLFAQVEAIPLEQFYPFGSGAGDILLNRTLDGSSLHERTPYWLNGFIPLAYQLQDEGADTVEANRQLGFGADEREYGFAVAVLRYFGLDGVRLLSNNPAKVAALESQGVRVVERLPCAPEVGDKALGYLRVKKEKLGHVMDKL